MSRRCRRKTSERYLHSSFPQTSLDVFDDLLEIIAYLLNLMLAVADLVQGFPLSSGQIQPSLSRRPVMLLVQLKIPHCPLSSVF
jgi:hypothetical protein